MSSLCTLIRTSRSLAKHTRLLHATVRVQDQHLNVNAPTFTKAIQAKGKLVLVDFYADWCGPCRMLSPILIAIEKAEIKTGTGLPLDLVTIDTDEHGDLAQKYNVSSLPTVIAFKDGEPVAQFVGALPEGRVKNFLAGL